LADIIPSLGKINIEEVTDSLIRLIGDSKSFRNAEANFQLLLPYLDNLTPDQNKILLTLSEKNSQVCHASLCASEYLPPILYKYGNLLDKEIRDSLRERTEEYIGYRQEWEDSKK
jgi:hypothetical protein